MSLTTGKIMPSQEVLHELLRYDPCSGLLYWRQRSASRFFAGGRFDAETVCARWNCRWAGKAALNTVNAMGYLGGEIFYVPYLAHRVIWKLIHGWDPLQVDHIDGVRTNNMLDNLRNVDRTGNARNAKLPSTNTSGRVGVYWHSRDKKWVAKISENNKTITVGAFARKEDAIQARKQAEIKHGYHPNHGARR